MFKILNSYLSLLFIYLCFCIIIMLIWFTYLVLLIPTRLLALSDLHWLCNCNFSVLINLILQVINRLKEEGHTCKGSSQKFFTDAVNKLLLRYENSSFLSPHVLCGNHSYCWNIVLASSKIKQLFGHKVVNSKVL